MEYELLDADVFNEDRYFDVFVEYAEQAPRDMLIQIGVCNRGPEAAEHGRQPQRRDGAEWIWTLVAEHFPDAIQIVDLYHARQHLLEVARQLYPQGDIKQKAWMKVHQKRLLDKGKSEKLMGALRAIYTTQPQMAEKLRTEADYFERNAERMRYPKFRRQHLFVGSGVIELDARR
jgi:hypothetical protein